MKKNRIWYFALTVSLILLIIYVGYLFINRNERIQDKTMGVEVPSIVSNQKQIGNKLPIPPLLEDKNPESGKAEFDLTVQYGETEFFEGHKTETLGYNGDYLGPIIKVSKGDEVKINVENTLSEMTTVHWHGLEVPAEMNGGPHQTIDPNQVGTLTLR